MGFPLESFLHCMKSSLYGRHRAPMKNAADFSGALVTPISATAGISAGRGVVSTTSTYLSASSRGIYESERIESDR